MPKILSLYVGLAVFGTIVMASAGLVGLLAVFTYLEEVGDFQRNYDWLEAFIYVGLSVPRLFYETIPFAVLIGGLVGLGGLAVKSELIVMRAAGRVNGKNFRVCRCACLVVCHGWHVSR